ncbi:MAG: Co2+/Mg2+ efflux protein ApaG [Bacteroidetes bacterium]|nr:Co2+/Mg2+ efflux protein ApaG [Bacteroidota bacterium]
MNYTATSHDIRISVLSEYQESVSIPDENNYVFTYRVVIENLGSEIIQVLGRHWKIVDTNGMRQEVEGEGVVGEKPIIYPGDAYEYGSWCKLTGETGKMWGTYLVKRISDNHEFRVIIPEFMLIPNYRKN